MILVNDETKNYDAVVNEINKRLPHLEVMAKFDNLLDGLDAILAGIKSSSAESQRSLTTEITTIQGELNDLQQQ